MFIQKYNYISKFQKKVIFNLVKTKPYKLNTTLNTLNTTLNTLNTTHNTKSIILYEAPKNQIIPIQNSNQKNSLILLDSILQKEKQNNIKNKKYCKLTLLSVSSLSAITICTYGYLIYNDLELFFLL